jgi:predicted ArsR family transcriptional regulator
MSIYKDYSRPLARRTDPESSHIAARRMVESGAQGDQQQITLVLVRKYPNRTSDELAALGSLDRYQLARRLPELERSGLVERGAMRKSDTTGRPACTWHEKIRL